MAFFLVEVNDFDFEIDLNKHLKCSFTTASRKFCSANDKVSEGKRQNIAAFCFQVAAASLLITTDKCVRVCVLIFISM